MPYNEERRHRKARPARKIQKVTIPLQKEISIRLKAEVPEVRYLKLKPFHRESRSKDRFALKPARIVPELRLCGNWLEDAGFHPDDYVNVTVMDGLLLIRSAEVLG